MNKFHSLLLFVLFSLASSAAMAAELEVVACKTDIGRGAQRAMLKLVVDDNFTLVAKTGPLGEALEVSTQVKVDAAEPVTEDFLAGFRRADNFRKTNIQAGRIKLTQHIFLQGNSDFHSDLYKLMDRKGNLLGWTASTIIISGCYAD
jgi:hypothetical protein